MAQVPVNVPQVAAQPVQYAAVPPHVLNVVGLNFFNNLDFKEQAQVLDDVSLFKFLKPTFCLMERSIALSILWKLAHKKAHNRHKSRPTSSQCYQDRRLLSDNATFATYYSGVSYPYQLH